MGCDIHTFAESRIEQGWLEIPGLQPFDWRSYGMYGFLADVRNYSDVPPIAMPRGIPNDASSGVRAAYEDWGADAHSASWLALGELAAFDYDAVVEDHRVTRRMPGGYWDGGQTCEPGGGRRTTYREFLGQDFFDDLEKLKAAGADRVIFWFDN